MEKLGTRASTAHVYASAAVCTSSISSEFKSPEEAEFSGTMRATQSRRAWLCPHSKTGRPDSVGELSAGHHRTRQPRELAPGPSRHREGGSEAREGGRWENRAQQVFRKLPGASARCSQHFVPARFGERRGLGRRVSWLPPWFPSSRAKFIFHYYWANLVPSSPCMSPSPLMESLGAEVTLSSTSTKEPGLLPSPFPAVPKCFF